MPKAASAARYSFSFSTKGYAPDLDFGGMTWSSQIIAPVVLAWSTATGSRKSKWFRSVATKMDFGRLIEDKCMPLISPSFTSVCASLVRSRGVSRYKEYRAFCFADDRRKFGPRHMVCQRRFVSCAQNNKIGLVFSC